jgi:hypothetical protein
MVTLPKTHSAFDRLCTVIIGSSPSVGTIFSFLYFANLQLRSFNEGLAVACKFHDLTIQL